MTKKVEIATVGGEAALVSAVVADMGLPLTNPRFAPETICGLLLSRLADDDAEA